LHTRGAVRLVGIGKTRPPIRHLRTRGAARPVGIG